jgi:serine protease Do
VPTSNGDIQLSFAPIVKKVAPAVVNVYATTVTKASPSPFAADPFFQRFFGGNSPLFQSRPRTSQSLGSGVIIDKSGLILTNSHVVHGATDVHVTLSDGHEYAVKTVLDDTKTDLAALKITDRLDHDLPVIQFADSDKLEVGDLVLAIGNPFGVGQTVTSGIVSALARTGVEVSDYSFFIQTDAAINPGNSGGALVDMQGRLVGINSAIFSNSSSGGSVGIGFAIPVNMAALVAHAAETGGQVVHPWFGAHMQALDADLAKNLKLDVPRGALITDLAPGGPAAKAGFKSGDVIIDVDGKEVDDPKAFAFRLATKEVGGTADMTVMRDGKKIDISLPLVASSADDPKFRTTIKANTVFGGITAEQMSPALAEEYGQPYDAKGVVVIDVAQGSRADQVGFKQGDIILNLNGTNIATKDDFAHIASGNNRSWQIVFERNGQVNKAYIGG